MGTRNKSHERLKSDLGFWLFSIPAIKYGKATAIKAGHTFQKFLNTEIHSEAEHCHDGS